MQYQLVKQQQEAVRIFQDLRKRGKGFSGLRPAEIKEKWFFSRLSGISISQGF
jgi:hypothetical protein